MPKRKNAQERLQGDAEQQFIDAHWGREPTGVAQVNCPPNRSRQNLVKMGDLEALFVSNAQDKTVIEKIDLNIKGLKKPWLCFGQVDNRLYICGGDTIKMARRRLFGLPESTRDIYRVEYTTKKGNESALYYHDHEFPFPKLKISKYGYPAIKGGRYHVEAAGIVG